MAKKIQTSRIMLNKHLEEKARSLQDTNKDRREQHDKFHKAITSTSNQLDHLARRMQFDIYRANNSSAVPIHPGVATSLIEHELTKSKFMDAQGSRLADKDKQMKQSLA